MTNSTDKNKDLITLTPGDLVGHPSSSGDSILQSMTRGALLVAQAQAQRNKARQRIGNYEFADPDYRQILLWAKTLGLEPDRLINLLANPRLTSDYISECDENGEDFSFSVQEGKISSLIWDFDELPLSKFELLEGLSIKKIAFIELSSAISDGYEARQLRLRMNTLETLFCQVYSLTELELSDMPNLVRIGCVAGGLTNKLRIANLPKLNQLKCTSSQLTELRLSDLPTLELVNCSFNELVRLELHNLPKLIELNCNNNQLIELHLLDLANLECLDCSGNKITKLQLSNLNQLFSISCKRNRLVELNLTSLSELTILDCSNNQLTELDLSTTPNVKSLHCQLNRLTFIDISFLENLLFQNFVFDENVISIKPNIGRANPKI